jgi:hypothetical protein
MAAPSAPSSPALDTEATWLRDTYQPDAPNLTVRAAIGGMLIGAVMCLSNLYVFFKTGWSMGVTLTACILAFASFQGLKPSAWSSGRFGPSRTTRSPPSRRAPAT